LAPWERKIRFLPSIRGSTQGNGADLETTAVSSISSRSHACDRLHEQLDYSLPQLTFRRALELIASKQNTRGFLIKQQHGCLRPPLRKDR
jgi:hypothetical protein